MTNSEPSTPRTAIAGRCPICSAPAEMAFRPFCSQRCRDVDLSRWLRGAYAIPGAQANAAEEGEDTESKSASSPRADDDGETAN